MLIATWNVNSIRTRINQVEDFLDEVQPDLLCLQETKVEDSLFPKETLEKRGYYVRFFGQKSYNGVAIISRFELEDVRLGFSGELLNEPNLKYIDKQKRIISAVIDGIRVINVYVPNGSSLDSEKFNYKIEWLEYLNKYLKSQSKRAEPLCLLGDFNIALEDRDIHNPKKLSGGIMASPKERELLSNLLTNGLKDAFRLFEQDSDHWSWWDYRSGAWDRDKGWRIDHIYISDPLINCIKSSVILKKFRGNQQPSDHAPVLVDIHWPPDQVLDELQDNEFYL